MAFFSSKSYDRDRRTLKRTYSTDRDRDRDRERQHGPSRSKTLPATSEFGVIMENGGGAAYSAAFPSAQMSPLSTTSGSGSLFVPPSAISPPSSTSHYPYLSTPKTSLRSSSPASAGASSGSTSKRTSRSPNPSRRRVQQHDGVPSPRDGSDAGHSSHSNTSNKKNEAIARARSSPDVRAERVATKSRSKASLRSHALSNTNSHDTEAPPASSSTPPRPPRSTRPPDSALENLPSWSTHASSSAGPSNLLHESSMFPSKSSSSSAALSSSYTSLGRQRPSHSPFPSASSRDQMDPMLVPPPKGYKPSGSVSDNSYGAPLSELGVGINMKRLLSKPAASSSIGAGGRTLAVRSEPDMDYGYNLLSAPRRRVETSSLSNMSLSSASAHTSPTVLRDGVHQQLDFGAGAMRKPATSDPEPRFNPGSIGRARGLEWGHVLDPEKEKERERGRSGRAHMRNHSSSFSLSSPSEGASAGYPIGLAFERERERVNASNGVGGATRPQIQLTTSAVRRFSALGAREVDSPVTPITFASSVSSANLASRPRSRQQQTPSPLAQAGVARRKNSPPPPGLTPAEIVAHAYKQQERRRAELARDASKDIEQPEKVGQKEREKAQKSVRGRDRSARSVGGEGVAGHDDEDVTTPYYTVFGNPTGRTVAIGTERDSAFGLFERGRERKLTETEQAVVTEVSISSAPAASVNEKQSAPSTLRRKLSKKMSGKFRRDESITRGGIKEGGKESVEGTSGRDKQDGDVRAAGKDVFEKTDSQPSLGLQTSSSERRSATLPREKPTHQRVKMSMDSFIAVQGTEPGSGESAPSAANGSPVGPQFGVAGRLGLDDRDRSVSDPIAKMKGRYEKHEKGEKGKLWGLVKRISTNALKDKYKRASVEIPPPVPALPHNFSPTSPLTRFDYEGKAKDASGNYPSPVSLTGKKQTSSSHVKRPSTAPALTTEFPSGRFVVRKKQSSNQNQLLAAAGQDGKLTTITRSSSPFSSDIASSDSFNRMQSNRSSASSYGDILLGAGERGPRTHKPSLGQHIMPPEKLFMLDDLDLSFGGFNDGETKNTSDAKNPVMSDYSNLFYSEESASHQALPVPPRRANQAKHDDFRSDSPPIPTFSADNAVNTFGFRTRSATNATTSAASAFTGSDFGMRGSVSSRAASFSSSIEPPPRPPRSVRRGPAAPSILQSSQSSHSSLSRISTSGTILEERAGRGSIGALSEASTARPSIQRDPPSPPALLDSQSPVSASDSNSSTLTFRDVNGTSGPTWSAKEKMEKWNDLLDRSDKAGGTLHVGFGGLLSDHLRDSVYDSGVRDSAYSEF